MYDQENHNPMDRLNIFECSFYAANHSLIPIPTSHAAYTDFSLVSHGLKAILVSPSMAIDPSQKAPDTPGAIKIGGELQDEMNLNPWPTSEEEIFTEVFFMTQKMRSWLQKVANKPQESMDLSKSSQQLYRLLNEEENPFANMENNAVVNENGACYEMLTKKDTDVLLENECESAPKWWETNSAPKKPRRGRKISYSPIEKIQKTLEQNKGAAKRYRERKQEKMVQMAQENKDLKAENDQLKNQLDLMTQEIIRLRQEVASLYYRMGSSATNFEKI